MTKVIVSEKEFYMDGYLKNNLDTAKDIIKKDWDMIFLGDGYEGVGKSVCIMQCAFYCDPTLSIDRIVFSPNEFQKAVMKAEKFQAIIYDEAYTGLNSRAAMTMVNRALVKMFAEIRQKNLFIFVVMPTFFDLDKYIALWRSRALIHVYTGDGFERGYFAFYNVDLKKQLYVVGKKFYSYSGVRPNFIGRFTNFYPVDEEAYRKKKKILSVERENKQVEAEMERETQDRLFKNVVTSSVEMSHDQKAKILGLPISTYYYKLQQFKQKEGLE